VTATRTRQPAAPRFTDQSYPERAKKSRHDVALR
jgi:hypothetical protein